MRKCIVSHSYYVNLLLKAEMTNMYVGLFMTFTTKCSHCIRLAHCTVFFISCCYCFIVVRLLAVVFFLTNIWLHKLNEDVLIVAFRYCLPSHPLLFHPKSIFWTQTRENIQDFHLSLFGFSNYEFSYHIGPYTSFTQIAALSTVTDEVENQVTRSV